jgi:hypothetical protein
MIYPWLSSVLKDIVSGTSFLILIMVSTIWFSGNVKQVYTELFDTFYFQIMGDTPTISSVTKLTTVLIGDILFHVAPCLLIGFPLHAVSILIAYLIIIVWYIIQKDNIAEIYTPSVNVKRAFIIGGVVSVLFAIYRLM